MKRRMLITILLVLLISAVWYAYSAYTMGPRDLKEEKADIVMNSENLLMAFQEDELQANELYLDKIISVTGDIASIVEDGSTPTIMIETGDIMSQISCEMADQEQLNNLSMGDRIRIKGQCTGFLSDVIMVKCVVE